LAHRALAGIFRPETPNRVRVQSWPESLVQRS
jgi:hypothetical protein